MLFRIKKHESIHGKEEDSPYAFYLQVFIECNRINPRNIRNRSLSAWSTLWLARNEPWVEEHRVENEVDVFRTVEVEYAVYGFKRWCAVYTSKTKALIRGGSFTQMQYVNNVEEWFSYLETRFEHLDFFVYGGREDLDPYKNTPHSAMIRCPQNHWDILAPRADGWNHHCFCVPASWAEHFDYTSHFDGCYHSLARSYISWADLPSV